MANVENDVGDSGNQVTIGQAVASELDRLLATTVAPGLYFVATPIGNLGDVSLRAISTLAGVDRLFCEDTRISRRLLERFGINRRLSVYHEHNASEVRPEILRELAAGRSVALISDAGTPAISDPGFKLATAALDAGHQVVPVPGPSAVISALTVSGLATDRFLFAGFLGQKSTQRRQQIEELSTIPATLVLYESPHRLNGCLRDLADVLGPRPAAVAREITKRYEEIKRGSLSELADWADDVAARGEITIVIGQSKAAAVEEVSDDLIESKLAAILNDHPPARAAKLVAADLGVPKSRVYDIGLKLKQEN
ncbi:MAG: 16S rRNA (cytidine(1402)-2'-O)-methyltransferase [Pseudomonadota bacterium]